MANFNRPLQIKTDSNIGAAIDLLGTYDAILTSINGGALNEELIVSAKHVADIRFNKYAWTLSKTELAHMFEWGASENSEASRLWKTLFVPGTYTITFEYKPSTRQVPVHSDLEATTTYRHVFVEKAKTLEEAPPVIIERDQSQWLRWHWGSRGKSPDSGASSDSPIIYGKNGIAITKGPVMLEEAGGGRYKNNFTNAFLMFWATGGAGTMEEVRRTLQRSVSMRMAMEASLTRNAKIVALKRSRAGHKGVMNSSRYRPETQRNAKKAIKDINRQLRGMRYRG